MTEPVKRVSLPSDARARQGVWLLLISLGVFFLASLILYMVYIYLRLKDAPGGPVPLYLPSSFIGSTVLLIGISGALHRAMLAARRDESAVLHFVIPAALVMAVLFFMVQGEGMWWMVLQMKEDRNAAASAYGLTLCLAIIHALHVVGGLVGLVWVQVNTLRLQYDHERHFGVDFCAYYWHFLDGVWLLLLLGFIVASLLLKA